MLEERNQGCRHGSHLVRGDVHIVDLSLGDDREVGLKTALDAVFEDVAIVVHPHVGEGDELVLLLLRAHIVAAGGAEVHLAVLHVAVRGLDESEVVYACIYAQRRDKSDVRAFRRLDRAETAIMRIMHVTDFESRPVPAQTSRAEGRKTSLVGDFRKRVGLVHKLRQLARPEE